MNRSHNNSQNNNRNIERKLDGILSEIKETNKRQLKKEEEDRKQTKKREEEIARKDEEKQRMDDRRYKVSIWVGIIGIIVSIVGSTAGILVSIIGVALPVKKTTKIMEEDIHVMQDYIAALNEKQETDLDNEEVVSNNKITSPKEEIIYIRPDSMLAENIIKAYFNEEDFEMPKLYASNTDTVAYSMLDGSPYIMEELQNVKVVFSEEYGEGSQFFFCGQFDDDNRWDGECLTNVYTNGYLSATTLGTYNSGKLEVYERISKRNEDWFYSIRKNDNGVTDGDSCKYAIDERDVFAQKLDSNTLSIEDFYEPQDIVNKLQAPLMQRYHGKISDGNYNDQTGTAWLISYYNDGTVKTVYSGNLVSGNFQDNSGNAWYITSDIDNNVKYMFYQGVFEAGHPFHEGYDGFKPDIDLEYAEKIIHNTEFGKYIRWNYKLMGK